MMHFAGRQSAINLKSSRTVTNHPGILSSKCLPIGDFVRVLWLGTKHLFCDSRPAGNSLVYIRAGFS
jgi:hypothetical protein